MDRSAEVSCRCCHACDRSASEGVFGTCEFVLLILRACCSFKQVIRVQYDLNVKTRVELLLNMSLKELYTQKNKQTQ
jgi:hypothetical protein